MINKMVNASDIAQDLCSEYPEVSFYDEREVKDDDNKVCLIFDIGEAKKEQLQDYIKNNYDCKCQFNGHTLYITAVEDDFYKIEDAAYDEDDFEESCDGKMLNEYWTKANPPTGGYTKQWAIQVLKDVGLTENDVKPDMEQIYHLYQAKQKVSSGQSRSQMGINLYAIDDPFKYLKYYYASILVEHYGYTRAAYNQPQYTWADRHRPYLPNNKGIISNNLVNAVNILALDDTTSMPAFQSYLVDRDKLMQAKAAKRAARQAKKAASGSSTTSAPVTPGTFVDANKSGDYLSSFGKALQPLTFLGYDVRIGDQERIIDKYQFRTPYNYDWARNMLGGSDRVQGIPSHKATVNIFDPTTATSLFKGEIIAKYINNSFDSDSVVFSGPGFNGLPAKQFIAFVKRKAQQAKAELDAQNAPAETEEAEIETETTEMTESYDDYDRSELYGGNFSCQDERDPRCTNPTECVELFENYVDEVKDRIIKTQANFIEQCGLELVDVEVESVSGTFWDGEVPTNLNITFILHKIDDDSDDVIEVVCNVENDGKYEGIGWSEGYGATDYEPGEPSDYMEVIYHDNPFQEYDIVKDFKAQIEEQI